MIGRSASKMPRDMFTERYCYTSSLSDEPRHAILSLVALHYGLRAFEMFA